MIVIQVIECCVTKLFFFDKCFNYTNCFINNCCMTSNKPIIFLFSNHNVPDVLNLMLYTTNKIGFK